MFGLRTCDAFRPNRLGRLTMESSSRGAPERMCRLPSVNRSTRVQLEHFGRKQRHTAAMARALADVAKRSAELAPGVAFGAVVDDETELYCSGVTSVENPLPVTGETFFQLGSVSKIFTATAAMALVGRGSIGLDDEVNRYLPGVDLAARNAVTIEHLLTHRGGWQGDWALFNAPASRDAASLSELVHRAPDVPRNTTPGGPFSYDNFGWCVLGAAVEAVTGLPFDEAVDDLVLRPLSLDRTVFWADDAITHRVAVGHTRLNGEMAVAQGTEPWADRWPTRRALWPTGGVVSTLGDVVAFTRAHLRREWAGRLAPIWPWLLDMQQVRVPSGGQGAMAGLGWHARRFGDVDVLSHSGAAQGFFARLVIVPSRCSALVALTNSAEGLDVVDEVFEWFVAEKLALSMSAPLSVLRQGSASLEGLYSAVTRSIRLFDATPERIEVEITDSGPTWGGTSKWTLAFSEGDRLVATDPDGPRMEVGEDGSLQWLRYRGRLHIKDAPAIQVHQPGHTR